MCCLLDTCVISELSKPQPNTLVQQWLHQYMQQCLLSAVTVGEIQFGIERITHGLRRNQLQLWFDQLCLQFHNAILPTDETIWRIWSRQRAHCQTIGRPQTDLDLLIAATALHHGIPLITRNTRHFQDTGLPLINPWGSTD